MARISRLKDELDKLYIDQKREVEELMEKHSVVERKLKEQCTHKYDNGTSAVTLHGMQWDSYYACDICKNQVRSKQVFY